MFDKSVYLISLSGITWSPSLSHSNECRLWWNKLGRTSVLILEAPAHILRCSNPSTYPRHNFHQMLQYAAAFTRLGGIDTPASLLCRHERRFLNAGLTIELGRAVPWENFSKSQGEEMLSFSHCISTVLCTVGFPH